MVSPRRLIERQKRGCFLYPEELVQIAEYRRRERLRLRGIRKRRLSRSVCLEHRVGEQPPDIFNKPSIDVESPLTDSNNADNKENSKELNPPRWPNNEFDGNQDYTSDSSLPPQQWRAVSKSAYSRIEGHGILGSSDASASHSLDDKYRQETCPENVKQDSFLAFEVHTSVFHALGRSSSLVVADNATDSLQITSALAPLGPYDYLDSASLYGPNRDSAVDADRHAMSEPCSYTSSSSEFSSIGAYERPSGKASSEIGLIDSTFEPDQSVEFDAQFSSGLTPRRRGSFSLSDAMELFQFD
ncbi:hypothetical protein V1509DRAFT_616260 [Lipomyces kononenkoae]